MEDVVKGCLALCLAIVIHCPHHPCEQNPTSPRYHNKAYHSCVQFVVQGRRRVHLVVQSRSCLLGTNVSPVRAVRAVVAMRVLVVGIIVGRRR